MIDLGGVYFISRDGFTLKAHCGLDSLQNFVFYSTLAGLIRGLGVPLGGGGASIGLNSRFADAIGASNMANRLVINNPYEMTRFIQILHLAVPV